MIAEKLQSKIDFKTKPLHSLGILEKIALKIGTIQKSLNPQLSLANIVVFAGDHGIANQGVSAYPQEVTYQMVMNFLQGGAAINVFCEQHKIHLKVVDAGVNFTFNDTPNLINAKVGLGTKSFATEKAMSLNELNLCLKNGQDIVSQIHKTGCNIIGFGEMGIGNTSSASLIMSSLCNLPVSSCIGRGTGLNDTQLAHKLALLEKAKELHGNITNPLEVLQTFGGFEIAQMCGAMLQALEQNMLILVDGFIASAAFLVAQRLQSNIIDNALFCHLSDEFGHLNLLNFLQVEPILKLNLRLGEGTGCALAYPIIQSSIAFLNNMASFKAAGVTQKT